MKISSAILSFSALLLATTANAATPGQVVSTCTKPGVVAWTFDDGPGVYNDQLLQILARNNVKATFFVIGEMVAANEAQGGAIKKIYDAGHQVASHTYTHRNLNEMSTQEQAQEINSTSDLIFSKIGVRPAYMRAPQGNCDASCAANMGTLNQIVVYWNADTNDWRHTGQPAATAATLSMEEVNSKIVAGNPATDSFILLQHEIHRFSVELLAQQVIDAIVKRGYRFVTVEECIGNPSYLGGITQPTGPAPPTGPTPTGGPGATTAPGGTVSNPSTAPSRTSAASGPGPSVSPSNNAVLNKAAAWAFGLAAAAAYALF